MVQLVKCLPSKNEQLSWFQNSCDTQDVVVHTCTPSAEETETGGSLGSLAHQSR